MWGKTRAPTVEEEEEEAKKTWPPFSYVWVSFFLSVSTKCLLGHTGFRFQGVSFFLGTDWLAGWMMGFPRIHEQE